MKFSDDEIKKVKELKRIGFYQKISQRRQVGSYLLGRHCPEGCVEVQNEIFLITHLEEAQSEFLWLPTLDELLEIALEQKVSFSQMTDYLHRKRFADGREREGILQLLIEKFR